MSNPIPSLIPTIVFVGQVNAGKSSLVNAFTMQDISIISEMKGTTTDEVVKRMELLDVGPINVIDTAGLNDKSTLGAQRLKKTNKALKRADLVLFVCDVRHIDLTVYHNIDNDKILIFNKIDLLTKDELKILKETYPFALFTSVKDETGIEELRSRVAGILEIEEKTLLADINLKGNTIIHVIPIDKEAPKGRLILPQMQLLRECLDQNLISIVLREHQLASYLAKHNDVALIVTDSQIFKTVSEINKQRFPLTSYSILQARQKGDLKYLIEGIDYLNHHDINKVLIMESCSHNVNHEDIGRVKIPKMIKELKGDVEFTFYNSHDFPDNVADFDFIIHCGSCMLSRKIMLERIKVSQNQDVKMSNYGLVIANYFGILDEATRIFRTEW